MAHRTAALLIDDDVRPGALVAEFLGKHEIDVTTAGDAAWSRFARAAPTSSCST
jgi:DNA-binding response OmpR family regulator